MLIDQNEPQNIIQDVENENNSDSDGEVSVILREGRQLFDVSGSDESILPDGNILLCFVINGYILTYSKL